jgi:hypothetical protein
MGQIVFAQLRTRDEREHRESRLTTCVIGLARTKKTAFPFLLFRAVGTRLRF